MRNYKKQSTNGYKKNYYVDWEKKDYFPIETQQSIVVCFYFNF